MAVAGLLVVAGLGVVPVHTAAAGPATGGMPQEFAYTTAGSKVSAVNAVNGTVAGTVDLGPAAQAVGVAVSPGGTRAYTANGEGDSVSVLTTSPFALLRTVHLGNGTDPRAVAAAPDGSRVYLADHSANKVSVLDTAHDDIVRTFGVGARPVGLAVTPDSGKVVVADAGSADVSVIDTVTGNVARIAVGASPRSVAISPDGSRAYVANEGSGTVSVIDPVSRSVTGTLRTGGDPRAIALSPDGAHAYVAIGTGARLAELDVATGATVRTYSLESVPGALPISVAVNFDGGRVLAGITGSDHLMAINPHDGGFVFDTRMAGEPSGITVGTPNTAAVLLGDSFVSGNAGRWQGNAEDPNDFGDYWGTDRAAYNCHGSGAVCRHDASRVYGNTASTCMRSDSAEIRNATLEVAQRVNLACSGAKTVNLIRAGRGGQPNKGEAPQIDQLAALLTTTRVRMVVLTIGGNDLGFAGIITSCIARYTVGLHCMASQEPGFAAGLEQIRPKIAEVVRQVGNVMADAGYQPGSYRFVLQSYPSPVTTGDENRYPQSGLKRIHVGHCPIYNDDSDWVHSSVVPRIADLFKRIADQHHIEFLDLRNLFDGHEVCSKGAQQPARSNSLQNPLPGDRSEWARFFDSQPQGNVNESVHPDYFGQLAMGSCLTALYASPAAEWNHRCTGMSGRGPLRVDLTSTSLAD